MIRLNDEFIPPAAGGEDAQALAEKTEALKHGQPAQKEVALEELVALGAEAIFTECLRFDDPLTVKLATAGLWECWLNERGDDARIAMEKGMALMTDGDLAAAEIIFQQLARKYPDWAEALNKHATILYLQGQPRRSLELCRQVVRLKPNHFGAWHGLALCALQLEDWKTVLEAAQKALQIQPMASTHGEIVQLAKRNLGLSREE